MALIELKGPVTIPGPANFTGPVTIVTDVPADLIARLSTLETQVQILQEKQSTMATQADFNAVIGKINDATNTLATKLQALKEQIAAAGLPADQEASILAQLGSAADTLTALGADPANPVPEPTPSV